MKKILALAAVALLFASGAFADTYVNIPHPTALWDSTTGYGVALGIPGQGQNGLTYFATTSGTNNFTGTFEINGVAQTFPASGILVGTTDTQTLSAKTLTAPAITAPTITGNVTSVGNVAIGTTTASTVPLTIVGLGTTSPGTGGGYVCADSAGQTYTKSTCP